jgi:hypothetical protein
MSFARASAWLRSHRAALPAAGGSPAPTCGGGGCHAPGEFFGCPFDDGAAEVIALSYPGRADIDLWVALTGCAFVSNGFIRASRVS